MSSRDEGVDLRRLWQGVLIGVIAVLFFTRLFLPAESASQGDTLWIAGLWMLCVAVWAFGNWRAGDRLRLDWLDGAVALWIGGQVASAGMIVLTVGDKRSAANQAWEWVATGAFWLLLRHGLSAWSCRNALFRSLIVAGAVLGGFGLYQHYVSHPRLVAEYGPLFDQYRHATGAEASTIAQKLAQAGIPTEGPGLVLFEKRLRDSREPMGMFALANTFGGCLAVFLLLNVGEILAARRRGSGWRGLAPFVATIGLLGWCLLLTKSRTAWVGTGFGLLTLVSHQFRIATSIRRFFWPMIGTLLLIAGGSVALLFLGGLDRQVLSEAPKSLAYRIQYWQATSQLIADHPWLGVGPGNFRQHYLKYKLPEASEEIADPHNLFLEIAATGGVVSALGLMAFLLLGMVLASQPAAADLAAPGENFTDSFSLPMYWGATAASLLAFCGTLFCWGQWEDQLLVFVIVWGATAWLFLPKSHHGSMADNVELAHAAQAAAIALTVHLLGAGGIAYPAVCQLLMALIVLSLNPTLGESSGPRQWSWALPFVGLASLGLFTGLVLTGIVPVHRCRSLLEAADMAVLTPGPRNDSVVAQLYQKAEAADGWSSEPWRHQFEWISSRGIQSNESFDAAVRHLTEVIRRDPFNFWAPRTLGAVWKRKWQISHQPADIEQATAWLQRAHELYPTNSAITADLAFVLELAGKATDAKASARQALVQDQLNRQKGHVDRYLTDPLRKQLETLADP